MLLVKVVLVVSILMPRCQALSKALTTILLLPSPSLMDCALRHESTNAPVHQSPLLLLPLPTSPSCSVRGFDAIARNGCADGQTPQPEMRCATVTRGKTPRTESGCSVT
ncbi:hypothetical protein TRVL_07589 [Trypanosoma vivax]|nr:hypothetical protein TRVL_07589 [Trypanosoma vivax]